MGQEQEQEDPRCKYLIGRPKDMTVDQKFRLLLYRLRRDFSPDFPVKVRRVEKDLLGPDSPHGMVYMVHEGKPGAYYKILINKKYPWTSQFDTIMHEWAHTLTWYLVGNGKDHCDIFHRTFGNLYRAFVED